jgi:hypothetical protein
VPVWIALHDPGTSEIAHSVVLVIRQRDRIYPPNAVELQQSPAAPILFVGLPPSSS